MSDLVMELRNNPCATHLEAKAANELERLTSELNESERQTIAQLKRVLLRDERIAELEAENKALKDMLRSKDNLDKLQAAALQEEKPDE